MDNESNVASALCESKSAYIECCYCEMYIIVAVWWWHDKRVPSSANILIMAISESLVQTTPAVAISFLPIDESLR